jgi:hypothetical protein
MIVSFDLHDFSILNNYFDLLLKLREYYPTFKVSLFTVPFDIKHKEGNRQEALTKIKTCLDWIQIIPHGIYHNSSEMRRCSYQQFKDHVIPAITSYFNNDGLPFVKGFCAPHWNWNTNVVRCLDDMGWWGAISPKRLDMPSTKKFYQYSYALDEPYLEVKSNILKLHGHLNGTSKDDLGKCFHNIFKLPLSTEWHFVTDYLEVKA